MLPEPFNITSEGTSDIKPLREPLKEETSPRSSSFLENSSLVVAAKAERKGSGEQGEPTKIVVGEHLARLVRERWVQ
jgi:hypothetical protein